MEIIEESGRFRVGIEHDESAESPYDDGASPVVSLRRGGCGYVIQERTTWRTDDGRNMDTWETVDSCWGFYGWDYAEQTARDTFRDVFATL